MATPGDTPSPRARLVLSVVAASIVFLLAFDARRAMARAVFAHSDVTPIETDCFYHLRRIQRTAAGFPHVPLSDPWLDWPRGAVVPWPEGFDWIVAGAARLLGARAPGAVAVVAAWAPVAMGLGVVAGVFLLGLRAMRGGPGRVAAASLGALVAALMPQVVLTSMVGRIDHHVAEQGAVLALLAWCWDPAPDDATRAWRFEAVGAAILAASVWCFNGSVLYAALAAAVLATRALATPSFPAEARAWRGGGAVAFAAASLFVAWRSAPAVAAHGRAFDSLYASFLQPALLLAAGALLLGARLVARRDAAVETLTARRLARRVATLGVVVAVVGGVAVALVPAARAAVHEGLRRWLLREDGYMATIAEVRPTFAGGRVVDGLAGVYARMGSAGLALPLLGALALAGLRRAGARSLALGVFLAGLLALTLVQERFGRILGPVAGLAIGAGAWSLARSLPRPERAATLLPLALAALWLLDPRARRYLFTDLPRLEESVVAGRFLRQVAGARDAVFSPWPDANELLQVAQRPVLVSSFGSYVAPETFWRTESAWRGDEDGLTRLLDARGVRWVVAGARHFGGSSLGPPLPEAVRRERGGLAYDPDFFQRLPLAGLVLGGSGAPRTGVPHLRHWLPRMSVGRVLTSEERVLPSLWVYERVPGATVRGAGPEGALVVLGTRMRVDDRPHLHLAWTRVVGGAFALTTPLPTRWRSANLAVPAAATLRVGDGPERAIEIPEAAVREGASLR